MNSEWQQLKRDPVIRFLVFIVICFLIGSTMGTVASFFKESNTDAPDVNFEPIYIIETEEVANFTFTHLDAAGTGANYQIWHDKSFPTYIYREILNWRCLVSRIIYSGNFTPSEAQSKIDLFYPHLTETNTFQSFYLSLVGGNTWILTPNGSIMKMKILDDYVYWFRFTEAGTEKFMKMEIPFPEIFWLEKGESLEIQIPIYQVQK